MSNRTTCKQPSLAYLRTSASLTLLEMGRLCLLAFTFHDSTLFWEELDWLLSLLNRHMIQTQLVIPGRDRGIASYFVQVISELLLRCSLINMSKWLRLLVSHGKKMSTMQIQLWTAPQKKKAKQNKPKEQTMLQLKITYYLCIKGEELFFFKCMRNRKTL